MVKHTATTPPKTSTHPAAASGGKWYAILTDFFHNVGLHETVRGFEADLLVLSRAQHEKLPAALQTLTEEVHLCKKKTK